MPFVVDLESTLRIVYESHVCLPEAEPCMWWEVADFPDTETDADTDPWAFAVDLNVQKSQIRVRGGIGGASILYV
jgi:hypothetical protein